MAGSKPTFHPKKNFHILSLITIQKEARAKWSNSQQISTAYKFLMTTRALSFSYNSYLEKFHTLFLETFKLVQIAILSYSVSLIIRTVKEIQGGI